jgi:hypothetical protein
VAEIELADDYREKLIAELKSCSELIALLTSTSIERPWVNAELGACMIRTDVKVVAINYFIEESELQRRGILSILGMKNLLLLEDLDDYIHELSLRVEKSKQ